LVESVNADCFSAENTYAPAPATARGKPVHLGGDPKKSQDILYTCGTGVVIRNLKVNFIILNFKNYYNIQIQGA
jgi:hypothetical protein